MEPYDALLGRAVDLVGHLAWPTIVMVIVYLSRAEIKAIISAISERIKDPKADVRIGKEGIEIKTRLDVVQAQIESLEVDQEQMKESVPGIPTSEPEEAVAEASDDSGEEDEEAESEPEAFAAREPINSRLMQLADEYLAISHPDWKERIRLKDAAARRMAHCAARDRVSHDLLADQDHEGLILALAATIHSFPLPGDAARLLRISQKATKLHVRYKVAMAMARLVERKLATKEEADAFGKSLDEYKQTADRSLGRRIGWTQAVIRQSKSEDPSPDGDL